MSETKHRVSDTGAHLFSVEGRKVEALRKVQFEFMQDLHKQAVEKEVPLYLFASFADDLVLNEGELLEDHGDVDVICLRKDVRSVMDVLQDIGCDLVEEESDNPNYYSSSDMPHKINARRGEVTVDIPIMDFDESRQKPYYAITNNDGKTFHIYFDQGFFSEDNAKTKSILPKTISPLGLIQTRVFYPSLQDIEWREKDRVAAEKLRDKFFPGEDLSDPKFMPEIIEVEN